MYIIIMLLQTIIHVHVLTCISGPSITFNGRGYTSKRALASAVSSTTYLSIPYKIIPLRLVGVTTICISGRDHHMH